MAIYKVDGNVSIHFETTIEAGDIQEALDKIANCDEEDLLALAKDNLDMETMTVEHCYIL